MAALKSTRDICYHLVFGDLALDLLNQNLQRLAGHSVCWISPWDGSDVQSHLETAMRILRERDRQDIYKKKVKTTGPTQENWVGLPMLHNGKKKKKHPLPPFKHICTHTHTPNFPWSVQVTALARLGHSRKRRLPKSSSSQIIPFQK